MQLIVEVERQQDLQLLTQFLEQLKISYTPLPPKKNSKNRLTKTVQKASSDTAIQKNFDIDKMEALFDKLHAMNAFADITDPVEWQRQLRDEWD